MDQRLSSPRKFNRPAKMPLIPATRPVDNISKTTESPISAPPIAAETGVKLAMIFRGFDEHAQIIGALRVIAMAQWRPA